MKTISLLIAGATLCLAGETRSWTQSDYSDFQKGNLKNLSIRSDGRLSLAPRTTEIYDSSTAYLWALARDSHGDLYTAGGPGAKLFRIPPNSKGEKIAEFDALEIHAIAVDSKDRVYVATAPDGKVYRVGPNGKTDEFYDPKQKYIWSMLCDPAGNLYVATGENGEVHKVTPDGKGEVFFKTDETHARSMALDYDGNLIVGTEPGGLVIRVSPKGEGFVLYQMSKREVTALAIGPKDEIYAAALGSKTASPVVGSLPPPPAAAPPGVPRPVGQAAAQPVTPVTIPGGSDVYRLSARQAPERLWTGAQDLVYALALDANDRLLIGSGNKGNLYRVETRSLYSTLVSFPVAQVTALLSSKDGTLYAATGNVGQVFRVGPGIEPEGSIESDVFDTGGFSTWGRLTAAGDLHGGKIALSARSGNLDRPQQNWSPWSTLVNGPEGGQITAPSARFVQWRATLNAGVNNNSPVLDSVETAYLRQNVTPSIDRIEITPANYKFPDPVAPLTVSNSTISLPPLGSTSAPKSNPVTGGPTITPAMSYSKGALGVRWAASDDNGDTLIYKVEIRGEKEQTWKLLRDKVREKYLSFDSVAFPDGEYRIRITASDSPSNTPENVLSTQEESDPFTIDNTPPQITKLSAKGNVIQWHVADALSLVRKAEYSLDGGEWTVVDPVTKLSDSPTLDYSLTLKDLKPGEHTIAVRATDDLDNVAVEKLIL